MNSKTTQLDRRQILKYGLRSVAGAACLGSGLETLLRHGHGVEAFAQATAAAPYPVIQICLIDKVQQALIFPATGTIAAGDLNGLDGDGLTYRGEDLGGQALPGNAVSFRGMQLTALFGNRLQAGLADGYNLAFIPQFTSQAGGHSLLNTDLSVDEGGMNFLIDQQGTSRGLLGFVGFNISGDANDSRDAAVAPGRIPLPTYDNAGQIRDTLRNTIAPLNADQAFLDFRRRLDGLAIRDSRVLDTLLGIRERVNPVLPGLAAASEAADIVDSQLSSVIALANAGLAHNFMIAIPWDDTNGGGDLGNGGGQARISPVEGVAMLAEVYNRLSRELPRAITVTVSDGGRSRNNGDAAGGLAIVSGPADLVQHTVLGQITALGNLGNTGAMARAGSDILLSNGENVRMLEHRHILSLVAKISHGITSKQPWPVGIAQNI